jgi:hypothetical protein
MFLGDMVMLYCIEMHYKKVVCFDEFTQNITLYTFKAEGADIFTIG